jgi:ketosteroid isomerase-like protein
MKFKMLSASKFVLIICLIFSAGGAFAQNTTAGNGKRNSEQTTVNRKKQTAAEQSLRDFDRRWQAMATAKNADGMAELYTAYAEWLPPNEKQTSGRAMVRAAYAKIFGLPDFSLLHTPRKHIVAASGETAIEYSIYQFQAKIAGADFADTGKYMFYLRKENGEWRIAADIFNSDNAPGATNNDK